MSRQLVQVGGAGGTQTVEVLRVPNLTLALAGKAVQLPHIQVGLQPYGAAHLYRDGNLGQDVMQQYSRLSIDFRNMRISGQ